MAYSECGWYLIMPSPAATTIWLSAYLMRPGMDHRRNSATLVSGRDSIQCCIILLKITLSNFYWLKWKVSLIIIYFSGVISHMPTSISWTSAATSWAHGTISRSFSRVIEDSKHMSAVLMWVILDRCSDTLWFIWIFYGFTVFAILLIRFLISLNLRVSVIAGNSGINMCLCRFFSCCRTRVHWSVCYIRPLVMSQDSLHIFGGLRLRVVFLMFSLLNTQVLLNHMHWL